MVRLRRSQNLQIKVGTPVPVEVWIVWVPRVGDTCILVVLKDALRILRTE